MIRLPLRAKPFSHFLSQKLYNKSYFEAARSLRNRSILDVCEDSENEADAERALLYNFYLFLNCTNNICRKPIARACAANDFAQLVKISEHLFSLRAALHY